MLLLHDLPNEILLLIAKCLQINDLYSLLQTSRFFALLLVPLLRSHALQDQDGLPPLYWAAKQGHEPLVRLLLDQNIGQYRDPETYHSRTKKTPLIWAAERGHTRIVKLLLERGADVDDSHNSAALTVAIRRGNIAVVRLLLRSGLYPSAADKSRQEFRSMALHVATFCTPVNETLLEMLLGNGADINVRDVRGGTVLHGVCRRRNDQCMLAMKLLRAGIDINAKCTAQETALSLATARRLENLVKLLLENGADMEIPNTLGNRPLHVAVSHSYEEITKILLDAGADIYAKNNSGLDPVDIAKNIQSPPILKLFFDYPVKRQNGESHVSKLGAQSLKK